MADHLKKPPVKSALFVDFDNIYLGLDENQEAAERFATEPARWLAWMEQGMLSSEENGSDQSYSPRSILLRNCYANPRTIHNFRSFFIRAAFSVIDCPALTNRSKNSSDIRMVMDIMDVLEHETHFDEFIILSGDSDFMPLLMRLRAHDRSTAILTVGPTAEAYKAAADRVIGGDTFIEDALGIIPEDEIEKVLDAMAVKLNQSVHARGGVSRIQITDLFREFPAFRASTTWLGFESKRNLTEELVRRQPELLILEGDIWRVISNRNLSTAPGQPDEKTSRPLAAKDDPQVEGLREKIVAFVKDMVEKSPEPVTMAKAAIEVRKMYGEQIDETHWCGTGSFKALLASNQNTGFEMLFTSEIPGLLFDPKRHVIAAEVLIPEKFKGLPPDLSTFIRKVSQITGAPRLAPKDYACVFQTISEEVKLGNVDRQIVSKNVRDKTHQDGASISRKNIWFILTGIRSTGHRLGEDPERDTPQALAEAFRDNVLSLCNGAQYELSPEERRLLDMWILESSSGEKPEELV